MRFTIKDSSPRFSTAFPEDDATTPAAITPPNSICGNKVDPSVEQWVQASCGLRDNPSLMTPNVLILALQNQPPVHVIRFLLSVNPKAASIPKTGPTPLQVAVQNLASLEVLETLLEACPFALCVTNPEHAVDPLSYAKRHRKRETEVIELLTRPLNYWVTERNRDPNNSMTSFHREGAAAAAAEARTPPPVDQQELNNVKLLCAQTLKGHKKLAKLVATCQEQLEAKSNKSEILKELQEQQQKHFYRQLIALDMKEKAMRAHVNKMEERCMNAVDSKVKAWKQGMNSWKSSTEAQMKEWQILLEHEVKINAHFRNDLGQWMEEQVVPVQTPFMFATNLGELNEEAPLFPDKVAMAGDLDHVKKRPWKPLFRHWDRIMLHDEEYEG